MRVPLLIRLPLFTSAFTSWLTGAFDFFFHTIYSLRKLFSLYNIVDEFFTRILILVLAFILEAILALHAKISIYQINEGRLDHMLDNQLMHIVQVSFCTKPKCSRC